MEAKLQFFGASLVLWGINSLLANCYKTVKIEEVTIWKR